MRTFINQSFSINCRGKLLIIDKPIVMGILNLTPNSFSDGGMFNSEKKALFRVEKMVSEGVDIIDIGPQSTNPNSSKISSEEEIKRLGSIISQIKKEFPNKVVSIDTFYSKTAKYANDEGVDIINDISAGQFDKEMFKTVSEIKLPYILMHVNPSFSKMHEKKFYSDIIISIKSFFHEKICELTDLKVCDIILDPGFGFGKTIEDQYKMIDEAEYFYSETFPILVGISRKSFIYKSLGKTPLDINDETQNIHMKLLKKGVKILRTHDVLETKKTIKKFLHEENIK